MSKKITDLQLIDAVTGSINFPVDDTIQTYRATPAQMKTYMFSENPVTAETLASSAISQIFNARLTLATGIPVTTTDQTAKTTIYLTPFNGDKIALYDGTKWVLKTLTEISISVPATTDTMYDLFVYDNAGTITLEAVAWTNITTRATAITQQNGVDVKTGTLTKRLAGSFCTTGVSGQTEDSDAKRFVSNRYNRVLRKMSRIDSADSWNYTLLTWRQANASAHTLNQLRFVNCIDHDVVRANVGITVANTAVDLLVQVGIGLDSTTTNHAQIAPGFETLKINTKIGVASSYNGYAGVGQHNLVWLERSSASGTTTWYGDNADPLNRQAGMIGEVFG